METENITNIGEVKTTCLRTVNDMKKNSKREIKNILR